MSETLESIRIVNQDDETAGFAVLIAWGFLLLLLFWAPWEQGRWALAYLLSGIGTVALRIWLSIRETIREKRTTSVVRELRFSLNDGLDNLFTDVVYWPVTLLALGFWRLVDYPTSYRHAYEMARFRSLVTDPERWSMRVDTAWECSRSATEEADRKARELEVMARKAARIALETPRSAAQVATVTAMLVAAPHPVVATESAAGDSRSSLSAECSGFFHLDATGKAEVDFFKRIRALCIIHGEAGWGAVLETDLAKTEAVNGENRNWLEKAYVFRKRGDTEVRLGRLFLAGQYSTPAPFLLKTVNYAKAYPFSTFAYGVQVVHKWDSGWWLAADVSGASGLEFDDGNHSHRLETSGRLKHTLSDSVSHGFGWQFSEDFTRLGVDVNWTISLEWNIMFGVFYSDQFAEETTGLAFLEWVPISYVRPHMELDFRPDGATGETAGFGIYWGDWRLLLDYQFKEGDALARLQYHW